jgi:GNAT superfamily N-acetyltransferase
MTTVIVDQTRGAPHRSVKEVAVLGPTGSDLQAVLAMVARCSRSTLYHRFHGPTDGVAYYDALLRNRTVDPTLLAWQGSTCVGVASLGVGATGNIDLAVLVEDAWQRRGIGTQLVESLLDSARARGVASVHADVLGDDPFILRALRRIGPLTVSIEFGTYSIDMDIRRQPSQSSENKLPVGFGTATGGCQPTTRRRPRRLPRSSTTRAVHFVSVVSGAVSEHENTDTAPARHRHHATNLALAAASGISPRSTHRAVRST